MTHDDVGRIFYSNAGGENPVTDFQRPILYGRISLPGEQAPGFREVFPIDNIPDTQGGRARLRGDNTLNRFTASCGQSVYRGDRLPTDYYGDLVICEPVGSLIRRAKVINDRGRIVVSNAYNKQEFIVARDPDFRPVNSATGPNGCLYIVDMYRGIIQEGNWVRTPGAGVEVVTRFAQRTDASLQHRVSSVFHRPCRSTVSRHFHSDRGIDHRCLQPGDEQGGQPLGGEGWHSTEPATGVLRIVGRQCPTDRSFQRLSQLFGRADRSVPANVRRASGPVRL
jgi:hypothetical protein